MAKSICTPTLDCNHSAESSSELPPVAIIDDLIFSSDPLRRTYQQTRLPIVLRATGLWFRNTSGEGKSTAAVYCTEALKQEFIDMPVYLLNMHMLPENATRSIPVRLMEQINPLGFSGEITRLRIILARLIHEQSLLSRFKQCVLVIDEGQKLRVQDLFFLKDLSNELALRGTGLVTIIFCEAPGIGELLTTVGSAENRGLAERFFVRELYLEPYKTRTDWFSLLSSMDSLRFDPLDGKTVAETYRVDQQRKVHLFTDEIKPFWSSLIQAKKRYKDRATLRRIFLGIRWWVEESRVLLVSGKTPSSSSRLWSQAFDFGCCSD